MIGHLAGAPDAPARLIVYGTFECLHCRRAWPVLRALADDAPADLAVEWRHFAPAGAFPNATGAALVAEAAALQSAGAYWALHDVLMTAPAPLWPEQVIEMARVLGLDVGRIRTDVASESVRARVEAQRAAALADGVRGTPSAFLVQHGAPAVRVELADLDAVPERVRLARAVVPEIAHAA